MKRNLGKVFLILLFFTDLLASEYIWKVSSSKSQAYVNEGIYLKYVCEFSDRAELYAIDFNPVTNNDRYTIIMLSEGERIINSKTIFRHK